MTLGCDIVAVLMRALNMLHHQTSPAQYALLTPDERKATLHQLAVTVDTAAKLAEVAHVDAVTAQGALAGGLSTRDSGALMDEIAAETERFKVGSARIRREEIEMVNKRAGEEGEEAGGFGGYIEGVVEETAGEEEKEAGKVGEHVEGAVEGAAGVGSEEVIVVGEMKKAVAVVEAPGVVEGGGVCGRGKGPVRLFRGGVEGPVRWFRGRVGCACGCRMWRKW